MYLYKDHINFLFMQAQVSHISHAWTSTRLTGREVSNVQYFERTERQFNHGTLVRIRCFMLSPAVVKRSASYISRDSEPGNQGFDIDSGSGLRRATVQDEQPWLLAPPLSRGSPHAGRHVDRVQDCAGSIPGSATRISDMRRVHWTIR